MIIIEKAGLKIERQEYTLPSLSNKSREVSKDKLNFTDSGRILSEYYLLSKSILHR